MSEWVSLLLIFAVPFVLPPLFRKMRKRFFPPKYDPVSDAFDTQRNGGNPYTNAMIAGSPDQSMSGGQNNNS